MADLSVEIVTGERVVYERDNVSMVVAPGAEGSLGILPSHAPLVSLLKEGELRVTSGGDEESIAVHGGFLEVVNNKVVILADTAERASEIDVERARAAESRAAERLAAAQTPEEREAVQAELERARNRLRTSMSGV